MRKIFILSLAILLVAGAAFALTRTDSPGIGDKLGQSDFASDPHKIFRLVRLVLPSNGTGFDSITEISKDTIVTWDLTSDDGVTVTVSVTSCDSSVAGILVTNIATPDQSTLTGRAVGVGSAASSIGAPNWGWMQTYGKCESMSASDTVITAGYAFGCGKDYGKIGGYPGAGVAGTGQNAGKAGFVYDAVTAGTTDNEVFLVLD